MTSAGARSRVVAWALIGIALVVVAVTVVVRSGNETDQQRAARLSRSLACPVCTGESVAASNASEAQVMRRQIREGVAAGRSDAEIIEPFVVAYGDDILLEPDAGGLGAIVWALPVLLVGGGGAALAIALRRWSRAPRLVATAADEELVARLRATHDREVS